ncbi:MAG: RsmE family RNA methyltransferase [Cardiobacterium hominis]
MREFRLFSSQPLTVGEVVTLDASAHRHVGTVLRLRVGAPLVLFNGDGFDYAAELVACDRRTSQVRILAREAVGNESPLDLVLFAALLKGEATYHFTLASGVNS